MLELFSHSESTMRKNEIFYQSFKRQPHKMVKHTQIIGWQQLKNCLSVFGHFEGLAIKGLRISPINGTKWTENYGFGHILLLMENFIFCAVIITYRSVFNALSNIYDGAFLQKHFKAFNCRLFSQKVISLMFDEVLNTRLKLIFRNWETHKM